MEFDGRLLSRGGALRAIGVLGGALAAAPGMALAAAETAASPLCVVTPEQTAGPYFVDERLNRADLTAGATESGVVNGVPLRLGLVVYAVRGTSCAPLAGAHVDLWHADATGVYSDVAGLRTGGRSFLRGYQVTDRNGAVAFTTIYPGWYPGRTPHVHLKVRTYAPGGNLTHSLTSQLYFDEAVNDAVFAAGAYAARGRRDTTNANDGIFERRLTLALTRAASGYAGTMRIGLAAG